ncbi:MAG: thymidylate kinase [Candidatus Parcubacteria bacterium]|nr:MAG: thymidylate kinase [Candidatus Parcubacteria bacterium]
MYQGKLVIIDGIDGAGKTFQAKTLFKLLKKLNNKVILTKEPQNKNLIKLIKENKDSRTDLFLFLADRSLHYQKIIKWLKQGYFIISDRSFPATLAYQYYASDLKKIKEDFIFYLDHLSRFHLDPDLVFILDLSPKIAFQRLKQKSRQSKIEKFEKIKFLTKVREGFLYFAKKFKWQIIDASKSEEEVHLSIKEAIQNNLKLRL